MRARVAKRQKLAALPVRRNNSRYRRRRAGIWPQIRRKTRHNRALAMRGRITLMFNRLFAQAAAAALLLVVALPAADAQTLALKRVMLSSGGVGYFEYEATVDGASGLKLTVRRDQVDDVLKSVVVYDDRGRVGSLSLPGEDTTRAVFRDLPFGPEALANPVALLEAMRGHELVVSGTRALTGRIVGVMREAVQAGNGAVFTQRHRVSLATTRGIEQFVLEEAEAMRFTNPAIQGQIDRALAGLPALNRQDQRELSVEIAGTGRRTVRVAYVVGAPLWKATYRMTLSSDPDAKTSALQGWAVLENDTGIDWTDVELSLVGGNPVTFHQALYAAYYVQRPEVPVEVLGRVLPRPDEGGVAAMAGSPLGGQAMRRELAPQASPPPPPAMAGRLEGDASFARQQPLATAELASANVAESQTQVVFRVPTPVRVATGHSLVVPLIDANPETLRLSLFQPQTQPRNPLASVRLVNAGGQSLPPGVMTIYERAADNGVVSYLGDARFAALPAGEARLLSFAVDGKTKVDTERGSTQTLVRAKLADGVLQLTSTEQLRTTYTIVAPPGEKRRVWIEHPRMNGDWEMAEPSGAGIERTSTAVRLPVEVAAGATQRLNVVFRRPVEQRLQLNALNAQQIAFYASQQAFTPQQRQAITRLGELAQVSAERERSATQAEGRLKELTEEQERVRRNLGSVGGDLNRRYLEQMGQLEDRIARTQTEIATARDAREKARSDLAAYIRGLNL
jgi:hypothetical protein